MLRTTFTDTMDRLLRLIQAGYPVIYLVSQEESRVFDCVARIVNRLRATNSDKQLVRWSHGRGLEHIRLPPGGAPEANWLDVPGLPEGWSSMRFAGSTAPGDALATIEGAQARETAELRNCVAVFYDLHPYLGEAGAVATESMVRPLRHAADRLRDYYDRARGMNPPRYQTVIIVAPYEEGRSRELASDVITLEFPLPEADELHRVVKEMVGEKHLVFPNPIPPEDYAAIGETAYNTRLLELIASAGRGLTLHSFKQGLNMMRVEDKLLRPKFIDFMLDLKADTISNRALEYTPHVRIELGGLELVKQWVSIRRTAATSREIRDQYRLPSPKGVLLCGASGGGKSQLAKLIAKEFNLALLRLDIGSLFGSYVGESEQRARNALRMAEVLAPVVLWIDEMDKAFAGAAAGGGNNAGDGGVSARVLGHLLTWLAEKEEDVFVVVTANDHRAILTRFPEFARKGRFDEIFWVDLPKSEARRQIFEIYLRKLIDDGYLQVADEAQLLNDLSRDASQEMTGAEIEYAVQEALYRAYDDHRNGVISSAGLTSDRLLEVVRECKDRSLYNGEGKQSYRDALADAENRRWLRV